MTHIQDLQTTNDPDVLRDFVCRARRGFDLVALLRFRDVRRMRIVGRHAPACAIDKLFLQHAVENQILAFALLQNPNLPLVDTKLLCDFAVNLLATWIKREKHDQSVSYILSLVDAVPDLAGPLAQRFQQSFESGFFKRATIEGSAVSEIYLAIVDSPDPQFLHWLTDKTGVQVSAHYGVLYHPAANKELWLKIVSRLALDIDIFQQTAAAQDRDVRTAYYITTAPKDLDGALIQVLQEEDEGVIRAVVPHLSGWEQHALLSNLLKQRRPLSADTLATFLESSDDAVRELAITHGVSQATALKKEGEPAKPEQRARSIRRS